MTGEECSGQGVQGSPGAGGGGAGRCQYQEPLIVHLWGGGSQETFLEEVTIPLRPKG